MSAFLFVALGLVILLIAGDLLVKGTVALSLRLGVPAMIVSLTVVAFGTSAPELLVAIQSALKGASGIAMGNVVGSNIANVLLVIGVPALISRIDPDGCESRRSYLMMMAASLIFVVLCFMGPLASMHGAILLVLFAFMLADSIYCARRARRLGVNGGAELAELEDVDPQMPPYQMAGYIALGIAGLPFGAQLMIDGALDIAQAYGVGEEVIGLTLVAIGTSLPELATTVVAAMRKQMDVVLGNVIGSNLFNILAIMGFASFFGPIEIAPTFLNVDLWVMVASSALLGYLVFTHRKIGRRWGIGFLLAYMAYIHLLIDF